MSYVNVYLGLWWHGILQSHELLGLSTSRIPATRLSSYASSSWIYATIWTGLWIWQLRV